MGIPFETLTVLTVCLKFLTWVEFILTMTVWALEITLFVFFIFREFLWILKWTERNALWLTYHFHAHYIIWFLPSLRVGFYEFPAGINADGVALHKRGRRTKHHFLHVAFWKKICGSAEGIIIYTSKSFIYSGSWVSRIKFIYWFNFLDTLFPKAIWSNEQ